MIDHRIVLVRCWWLINVEKCAAKFEFNTSDALGSAPRLRPHRTDLRFEYRLSQAVTLKLASCCPLKRAGGYHSDNLRVQVRRLYRLNFGGLFCDILFRADVTPIVLAGIQEID